MPSIIQGDSLLAVDIGAATTRAVLFDVVEGEYRLVSAAQAPTTVEAPYRDVLEGVRSALSQLQTITGSTLLDADGDLITPAQEDGSGVDSFVATLSAGPALRAVVAGLLPDASVESARRLTETVYARIVDHTSLQDHRRSDELIDSMLRLHPDIVVMTGGTDGGASRSLQKMLEPIGLASYLMPLEQRPAFLFAGNQAMEAEVRDLLASKVSVLSISPNVRPTLDTEDLDPAARELARLYVEIRRKQIRGVDALDKWAHGHILPTGYATGRMMRFLSKVYGSSKGILAVDLGASAATIAAGFKDRSTLGVYPHFGLGENLSGLLNHTSLESILAWSPMEIPPADLRDYLYQKSLHPAAIAATREDQAMSYAVARQALALAMQAARHDFPRDAAALKPGLLPLFEPILAGGGPFSNAPTPGQSLLLLLDALQPVGLTTVILDQNNLIPLLGAAAGRNPLLPIQVLESGAFMSLGTVVAPIVTGSYGSPVLKARVVYEDGTEARAEVKYGTLQVLPLPSGQTARLTLQAANRGDLGFGPGREGTVTVSGGSLGIVFDCRGRPIALPTDTGRRHDALKNWHWTLGG